MNHSGRGRGCATGVVREEDLQGYIDAVDTGFEMMEVRLSMIT